MKQVAARSDIVLKVKARTWAQLRPLIAGREGASTGSVNAVEEA